jgi:hypothetical protein
MGEAGDITAIFKRWTSNRLSRIFATLCIELTVLAPAIPVLFAQRITSAPIDSFSATGPTGEVLRDLLESGKFRGVLGFENLGPAEPIAILSPGPDVGAVLGAIVIQDRRYRVVEVENEDLVEIIAADARAPGHEILEHRIANFDLEADDWPSNILVGKLDWYSHDLNDYLTQAFAAGGGIRQSGSPASILSGNIRPPHLSLHLKNVTIREILNAVSLLSLRMSRAGRTPGVYPMSWEFRYRSPTGLYYSEWLREIFRALN